MKQNGPVWRARGRECSVRVEMAEKNEKKSPVRAEKEKETKREKEIDDTCPQTFHHLVSNTIDTWPVTAGSVSGTVSLSLSLSLSLLLGAIVFPAAPCPSHHFNVKKGTPLHRSHQLTNTLALLSLSPPTIYQQEQIVAVMSPRKHLMFFLIPASCLLVSLTKRCHHYNRCGWKVRTFPPFLSLSRAHKKCLQLVHSSSHYLFFFFFFFASIDSRLPFIRACH